MASKDSCRLRPGSRQLRWVPTVSCRHWFNAGSGGHVAVVTTDGVRLIQLSRTVEIAAARVGVEDSKLVVAQFLFDIVLATTFWEAAGTIILHVFTDSGFTDRAIASIETSEIKALVCGHFVALKASWEQYTACSQKYWNFTGEQIAIRTGSIETASHADAIGRRTEDATIHQAAGAY